MSLYDSYETDVTLEENGVWIALTNDMEVKVAALGNKQHLQVMEKMFAPYKNQRRRNALDPKIEEDIHTKAIAKAVLLDWRGEGFKDRDGNALPYSFDNAYKLLTDESLKRFKADIIFLAKEAETFKQQDTEEAVKNSEKSSSGTSATTKRSKS